MRFVFFLLLAARLAPSAYMQMMEPLAIDGAGRATFKVDAPSASTVHVVGKGNGNGLGTVPIALAKSASGEWSVTTGPVPPGFHYYDILIDGVATTDLRSHAYFGWGRWTSGLEVPDPSNDFYAPKPGVPRGEIRIVYYDSAITGRVRKCLVYVPPGYDEDPERRYPALYLQHGSGESELAWLEQGKVNHIMDNLIHEGRAVPMLVVMDNGYAADAGATNWWRPSFAQNRFAQVIVEEIVPLVESRFRVVAEAGSRAMAGLSMGGQQSAAIVVRSPDTFAYLGMFSGGLDSQNLVTSQVADRLNDEMELVWMGAGRQDEFLDNYILAARATLLEKGVEHQFEQIDGAHEWQVWRKCLNRFAPKLFRPNLAKQSLDVSLVERQEKGAANALEIRLPERGDIVVERSRDLSTWIGVAGAGDASPPGLRVALPEQGAHFYRAREIAWEN